MKLHIAESTTELISLIISVTFYTFNADDPETLTHLFGWFPVSVK